MFSDASAGPRRFFTYEFEQHAADIHKYIQLYHRQARRHRSRRLLPDDAVSTRRRPHADHRLQPRAPRPVRLRRPRRIAHPGRCTDAGLQGLVIFQADIVDQEMLDRFVEFQRGGGKVIVVDAPINNVAGKTWKVPVEFTKLPRIKDDGAWLKAITEQLPAGSCQGVDGRLDGIWTCSRGNPAFAYNTTTRPGQNASRVRKSKSPPTRSTSATQAISGYHRCHRLLAAVACDACCWSVIHPTRMVGLSINTRSPRHPSATPFTEVHIFLRVIPNRLVPTEVAHPRHRRGSSNPLTARVMVNRIWQHHFGQGLVTTPSDFGKNGGQTAHPELIDWLASRFIESGWSIKAMHRLMLKSNLYRQSLYNPHSKEYTKIDPEKRLLWQMSPLAWKGKPFVTVFWQ